MSEVKPRSTKAAKPKVDLDAKRRAVEAVMQKIQDEARKDAIGKFRERNAPLMRRMKHSSDYLYELEIHEPKAQVKVQGLTELHSYALNSLPDSKNKQRFAQTTQGIPQGYNLVELQNHVKLGTTKFFMDPKGRIIKVTRLK